MAADTTSASGIASSVLRVRAFIQMHLQPVEDRAPPDAAIARPQHPVPFVREGEEFRVDAYALRGREGLIAFGKIHTVIELRMHDKHRRLPIVEKLQRR